MDYDFHSSVKYGGTGTAATHDLQFGPTGWYFLTIRSVLVGGAGSYKTYLYINGTQMPSDGGGVSGTQYASDGHLVFGQNHYQSGHFSTFVIDEFAVWDLYLSDTDLQIMIDYYLNL